MPRSTTTIPSASSMPSLASACRRGAHELRQHLTFRVGTPPRERRAGAAALVVRVDQVQIEVPRAMVREVLDLAAHPQLAVAGEGRAQRGLDLLVEPTDGEDPGGRRRSAAGRVRRSGAAASERVEPRDRRADGRRRTSSTPYRGAAPVTLTPPVVARLEVTVSRPGGRSTDRSAGPCRGRSGLRRAGCWLTASRGDPQESATERKPPMAGLRARTGKGERVR